MIKFVPIVFSILLCGMFAPRCLADEATPDEARKALGIDANTARKILTISNSVKVRGRLISSNLPLIRARASDGDPYSQFLLGLAYESGYGVKKDVAVAAKWFWKSAKQGHAQAQSSIGAMCDEGKGVAQSKSWAHSWFKKAADEHGEPWAQKYLANLYGEGSKEFPRDLIRAYRYAVAAEAQGVITSAREIAAKMKDAEISEAMALYIEDAKKGDARAQNILGTIYECGFGVDRNGDAMLKWYLSSIKQGNAWAMLNLGSGIEMSGGGRPSLDKAYDFYKTVQLREDLKNDPVRFEAAVKIGMLAVRLGANESDSFSHVGLYMGRN